jgi:predicted DNA-binding transcriptional regulator YafY
LALLQALRRRRRAVSAAVLAQELGVSVRTIYRDVATLAERGAAVEGAAGVGYRLRPGFFLPPITLDEDELDALVLGLRWVSRRSDAALARGAEDALAKILAVLPAASEDPLAASGLIVGGGAEPAHLAALRRAMRQERKLHLAYADAAGVATERTVWPVAIGFLHAGEVLAAWCELRQGFRHFRLDRIVRAEVSPDRYPRRRPVLLADWRLADAASGLHQDADTN